MGKNNKSAKETFSISATSSRAKPAPLQASSCLDHRPSSSRPRLAPLQDLSYTAGINFPPSLEEEEEENHDVQRLLKGKQTQFASVLEGEDTRDANVKDITIKVFLRLRKSTLLKLLAWSKLPVPKNIDILLVEQEVASDDKTAVEAVVSANEELVKLREEASSLLQDSDNGEKLSELYEKLQLLAGPADDQGPAVHPPRAHCFQDSCGARLHKNMQVRPTKSFSGGWRMRISLAGALFVKPTLLLLDEPTNHLDLRAVLWLEEYLCRWKNTLVVVSHGLDFLNTVCTDIIDLKDQKLNLYHGNFDPYEKQYGQLRKGANKKYLIHEKQRIKAAGDASKRKGKGRGKEEEEEEEEEGTAPKGPKRWRDYRVKLNFPEPTELASPPPLLQLIEVSFSYPERPDFKLSDVDLGIDMGTVAALRGNICINQTGTAGKSTLLNLVAGDLVPTEGEVRRSQTLRISRYSQHFVDQLKMEETPVHYLLRLHPDQEGHVKAVRAKLGKFGLQGNNHFSPIKNLSGGQKARVVLTSISMMKPHILLLDEPTNHLDMQTIDALADALDGFKGGVVLVSHDSRLISRVCEDEEKSEIWVVKYGTVTFFQGTFEEYKEELKREIKAEVDELS
ncbi:hypothetical protein Bca4012_079331 [Brassica carinata]